MRRRSAVLAATAAAVVASVATAVATIPGSDGTINGCYAAGDPSPHALSVVDDPAECKQTLLPFNQRGPTGATGRAGTLGSSSRVTATLTATAERDFAGTATCPAGSILLGGGFELDTLGEGFDVVTSRPSADVRGWDVTVKRRPGYVSNAEVAAALRGALDGYLRAAARTEEGERALAHALGLVFHVRSPGGASVSGKERTKIDKAVKTAGKRSKASIVAGTRAAKALGGLKETPAPGAPAAKAYAVCGAG
jgi:hypothetical protein